MKEPERSWGRDKGVKQKLITPYTHKPLFFTIVIYNIKVEISEHGT